MLVAFGTYPHNLLINVLSQVLATQHGCTCAGCVAHNAAYDDTQHICLRSQPEAANSAISEQAEQMSQPRNHTPRTSASDEC